MFSIHALNPHISVAVMGSWILFSLGKNPTYSMSQLRTVLLKDFDLNYQQILKKFNPEFVPTYKIQFEQVFDTSLLDSKTIFISSQNAIKALLHHHVNSINERTDVFIVGPQTSQYFNDCFGRMPSLVGKNASDLIQKIKGSRLVVKEPVLFLTGDKYHEAIPQFLQEFKHVICPTYSVKFIIDSDYFNRYVPEFTQLIVFSPEMARRIPRNKLWKSVICIGPTTRSAVSMNCPVYIAADPNPEAILDLLKI
eukprot:NODE_56_length_25944_cov_0.235287.p9 type:complete len:252 gc:universal NODE_56_length_25944_cov_0.235287:5473-4718(-)